MTRMGGPFAPFAQFAAQILVAACRAVQIPPFCKEGIPICKHLWERGRRRVDGPEEGNEVLPYGWVHDEMVPHAAKGIL